MAKPINFRPSKSDQVLLDELLKHEDYQTNADVIRWGIFLASMHILGEEKTKDLIAESHYK